MNIFLYQKNNLLIWRIFSRESSMYIGQKIITSGLTMLNDERLYSLFLKVRKSLSRLASTIVPPKEIEDIVQEAYVRICEMSKNESIKCPRSFMYRVVKNLALDHVKRAETRLCISLDDDENDEIVSLQSRYDEDVTLRDVTSKQEFEFFCRAVRELPLQCRRVFVLKKVYGYSQKEISEDLNISESTVEKHIAFGIKRCSYFMNLHKENGNIESTRYVTEGEVRCE